MRTVQIAELKSRLSSFLQQVRAGEEIVIRDRNLAVAKLVPIVGAEGEDELSLVADGLMTLPSEALDEESFWSMDSDELIDAGLADRIAQAIAEDRDDRDARVLGR